jgi:predicted Zn finger-like uncharacterized protein
LVIRCERCSTLYELDESLLSPSGSQVQCTRCQHLFTAYPSQSPGRTLVGVPAAAPPAELAPALAAPAAPSIPKARSGRPSSSPGRPEPKPVRTAPAPVYRPAAPAAGAAPPQGVARGPVLRRDTVGAFEARLRRSARMRWLAPVLAAVAIAVAVGGWLLLSRRPDGASTRVREEALALAALDDGASLDGAISRLEAIEGRAPAAGAATAERAFVQVLRAGALAEEGEALAARLGALAADRDRLRREKPAGWEDAERAAATEAQVLEPEVRAREERSRALRAAALEALRRVQAEAGDTAEVARGLAAYHALAGARDAVLAALRSAQGAAPDPWLGLAAAWLDVRDPDRAAHERALPVLRDLTASHPEILRARLLLARTQASLGRRAEAVATLDGLLAANARHEAARRLREELSAPRAPAPAATPPAPTPAVAVKPPPQPRKIVSPPSDPGSATPIEAGDSAGTPLAPAPVPAPAAAPAGPPGAAPTPEAGGAGASTGAAEPARRPAERPPPSPEPDWPVPSNGG